MINELISVKEFAEANGLLRQTVFKVIKRLGIERTTDKTVDKRFHTSQSVMHVDIRSSCFQ